INSLLIRVCLLKYYGCGALDNES
ncbi:hypothetical protein Gasu_64860, partial [Galdieria sulphuraria]